MCDVLDILKSTYYYHADVCGKRALKTEDKEISKEIARIFKESRNNYGTRKIKKELSKLPEPKHVFNREIMGRSAGANKTAELVYQALVSIRGNLNDIQMFHTDRGKEFDNKLISKALETFGIQRSLSMKGCPYDNAVAEAMFKVFKTEFANGAHLSTLEQLALELDDYVHWFNNIRIHGTLGYLTPVEFK